MRTSTSPSHQRHTGSYPCRIQQRVDIRQTQHRHSRMGEILCRMQNFKARTRRLIQRARKCPRRAALDQDRLFKREPLDIRKQQRLLHAPATARASPERKPLHIFARLLDALCQLRRIPHRFTRALERIIAKTQHRLPFEHTLARGVGFVRLDVVIVLVDILRDAQELPGRPICPDSLSGLAGRGSAHAPSPAIAGLRAPSRAGSSCASWRRSNRQSARSAGSTKTDADGNHGPADQTSSFPARCVPFAWRP